MKKVCESVKTWLVDNFWVLLVAIAAVVMAGFLGLVSWDVLIWSVIIIGALICIIFWIAGSTPKAPKANLERMSLEDLVAYADDAQKKAKKAKADAAAATEAEVASFELAKAKNMAKKVEEIAAEINRRVTANPSSTLLLTAKNDVDSYKAEAKLAVREAENAVTRFAPPSPQHMLHQKFNKALEKQAEAEAALTAATAATDTSVVMAEIVKAEAAAVEAESLADEAKAIADAGSQPSHARIAELTRKAAREAATAAANAKALTGSAIDKMDAAFNSLLVARSKAEAGNAAVSTATTKADAQPGVDKAKDAAKEALNLLASIRTIATANPTDSGIQAIASDAAIVADAIKHTAIAAENAANSKP